MPISRHGKFIRIQSTFIRIDSLVSILPKELIQYDQEDKIVSKDFPEIHVDTIKSSFTFMFHEFEHRDQAMEKIVQIISD